MKEMESVNLNFEGHQIRMLVKDGEPWWVLKDVCNALGIMNHRDAVSRLDKDCVGQTDAIDALGRIRKTNIVNEAGLYQIAFISRKENARRFRKWVTSEVLPSIRKTGSYSLKQLSPLEIMRNMLDTMITHEKKIQELQERTQRQEEKVNKIQEAYSPLNKDMSWRRWVNKAVRGVRFEDHTYANKWVGLYELLEERAHCDLKTRLANLRERVRKNGLPNSRVNSLNNLDVIESDPKLKEIFTSIIRELTVSSIK